MGWVYVPLVLGGSLVSGGVMPTNLAQALAWLLLYREDLHYLARQIDVCNRAIREGRGYEPHIHILGEKAADYAQQLFDERYGAVPALMDDPGVRV